MEGQIVDKSVNLICNEMKMIGQDADLFKIQSSENFRINTWDKCVCSEYKQNKE
jgi:hypothetical protein